MSSVTVTVTVTLTVTVAVAVKGADPEPESTVTDASSTGMILKLRSLSLSTGIFIIFEGRFHAFQRFSRSKFVLKSVESRFPALNCFENASIDSCVFLSLM